MNPISFEKIGNMVNEKRTMRGKKFVPKNKKGKTSE